MRSITNFLRQVRLAIDNIQRVPPVLAALRTIGYNREKLNEGLALLNIAEARHRDFLDKYNIMHVADEAIDHAAKKVGKLYAACSNVARMALGESSRQRRALALDVPEKRSFSGWVEQVGVFFGAALQDTEIQHTLTNFDVQPEKLEEGYAILQQVIGMKEVYVWETKEVSQAAKIRDTALDELDNWLTDFQAAAEIVLKDYPGTLATLRFDSHQKLFR